jgi:farnesyl-diphosphate farnesyltransferase
MAHSHDPDGPAPSSPPPESLSESAAAALVDPETADAAALDWCHDAVQDVSRTFAITVDVLAEPMASYICVGYLLCRVPDTVEDAAHIPPAEQTALLETYDRVLDPEDDTDAGDFLGLVEQWLPETEERSADWDVVAETGRILRAFEAHPESAREAMRGPSREMVRGMADFVTRYADEGGLRLRTREELREYCHYAAGTVGELVTNLVCREEVPVETERTLRANAESFGQLLQHVNVAKDVHDDLREENNVYLPADRLAAHGVPQSVVLAPDHREGATAVVREVVGIARGFLDDAQTYLEALPERDGNRVAAWSIPFLLAVGTLRELEERPGDALSAGSVKVSRTEVRAVIAAAVAESAEIDLEALRSTVAERPLDRSDL